MAGRLEMLTTAALMHFMVFFLYFLFPFLFFYTPSAMKIWQRPGTRRDGDAFALALQ